MRQPSHEILIFLPFKQEQNTHTHTKVYKYKNGLVDAQD